MTSEPVPEDIAALKTALAAERAARQEAEARASGAEAMVAHLKLLIARMKRDRFRQSAERGRQLLDQLELQLEELEASAAEDEAASAAATLTAVTSFTRRRPARAPLPAHLPRERVVTPAPCACPARGGRLSKLGEDITETLEVVPRRWKVIQTVREKFACRWCERITQPPAPFHPIARARAGPVLAAERLHGDDTTVPVLAKNKTARARLWAYVPDDRPFCGTGPPAALFLYSRDRGGEHPRRHLAGWTGILQADAYAGSANSTRPSANRHRLSKPRAAAIAGASSSSWPISGRRRWRSRQCPGSTLSSRSSAGSIAQGQSIATPSASSASTRWSAN